MFDKLKTVKMGNISDFINHIKPLDEWLADSLQGLIDSREGCNDYAQLEYLGNLEDLTDEMLFAGVDDKYIPEGLSDDDWEDHFAERIKIIFRECPEFDTILWDLWSEPGEFKE